MKRLVAVLMILAMLAGGGYIWWRLNSTRLINTQVQRIAADFVKNPERLTVSHKPVQFTSWQSFRVPQLVLEGTDIVLKNGLRLKMLKVVLYQADVTAPAFRLSAIGDGSYYAATVTDEALTEFIRQRGAQISIARIPLEELKITLSRARNTTVAGTLKIPFTDTALPFSVNGTLMPSSSRASAVDLRVDSVKVDKTKLDIAQVNKAFATMNPIIDLSSLPVKSEVKTPKVSDGQVVFTGKILGVSGALLPL